MANINVREIVNDSNVITLVKPQGPSVEDAEKRLNALRSKLDELTYIVNNTNVGNTKKDWEIAYSTLTVAFSRCILAEKSIIMEAE